MSDYSFLRSCYRAIIVVAILMFVAMVAPRMNGQSLVMSLVGPPSARPGDVVLMSIQLDRSSLPTSVTPVGLQWQVGLPIAAPGPGTNLPDKTLTCSKDSSFCLLAGLNTNPIPGGTIATYVFQVPPKSPLGIVRFPLSSFVAVDPNDGIVPVSLAPAYSLSVVAVPQDINGDGVVDITDVNLMTQEVIASKTNPAACKHDQNGDGVCDIKDVYNVILKSLGLI